MCFHINSREARIITVWLKCSDELNGAQPRIMKCIATNYYKRQSNAFCTQILAPTTWGSKDEKNRPEQAPDRLRRMWPAAVVNRVTRGLSATMFSRHTAHRLKDVHDSSPIEYHLPVSWPAPHAFSARPPMPPWETHKRRSTTLFILNPCRVQRIPASE
jgi:hypothetical protein